MRMYWDLVMLSWIGHVLTNAILRAGHEHIRRGSALPAVDICMYSIVYSAEVIPLRKSIQNSGLMW